MQNPKFALKNISLYIDNKVNLLIKEVKIREYSKTIKTTIQF